jgi:hypothetical protein
VGRVSLSRGHKAGVSTDGSFAGEKPEVFGYEALDCHCRPQDERQP